VASREEGGFDRGGNPTWRSESGQGWNVVRGAAAVTVRDRPGILRPSADGLRMTGERGPCFKLSLGSARGRARKNVKTPVRRTKTADTKIIVALLGNAHSAIGASRGKHR